MFLPKNYIVGNQLTEKMGIRTGNISIASKKLSSLGNDRDIIKIGKRNFINSNSMMLPKYLRDGIIKYYSELSTMDNLVPLELLTRTFRMSKNDVCKLVDTKDEFIETTQICDGEYIRFTEEFTKKFSDPFYYILNKTEKRKYNESEFKDVYELTNNRFIVWFN